MKKMKLLKLIILFLTGVLTISNASGQQANATLNILTLNSGVVTQGGMVDIQVTVGNTGPTSAIGVNKVRPQISTPAALVTVLPNAQQTGLPQGWTILSNNGSVIQLCNGTDVIGVGEQRQILIKIQGVNVGGPSTITGNLSFGPGTAVCTGLGTLPGDLPADNTSNTTIQVVAAAPCTLGVTASAGTIACNGGTTTLTATPSGANGAVEYSITGGAPFQSANTFTVGAGTYTVTAREVSNNTCTATATAVTIAQPAILTATATSTAVTTIGGSDGTATAAPSGGTSPYTYLWNTTPAQTGITATGLTAGSYTVTVTDANGCTTTATTTVSSPSCNLAASASAGTITCNGGTTTLTVTATGGTGALQYSLNGGAFQSGNTFTVGAGTYTVTVRDASGCTTTTTAVTVTQPTVITASASAGTIACNNGATTITVTASGGTGELQYSLNGGAFQSGNTFSVNAGTYTVTVKDANNCTATTTAVTIMQPSAIAASASAGTIACNGGTTTLTVTAAGGTGALEYSLNGGAYQPGNAFTVGAGTYTITVRDANSCTATASAVTISQPSALTATATSTAVTIAGGSDGTATAIPSGGTSPYTYSWNTTPVQTGITATGLTAGSYTVTVTDANGCITTATTSVGSPACNLSASMSAGTIACNGGTTTLTVTATGGSGVLEYSLNSGAFQPGNTFIVGAGTYTVTVRETASPTCTAVPSAVTVTQPSAITASASAGTIACNGGTTILTVTASGGTGVLEYSLNGGAFQSNNTFTVNAGTYTVTVRDANSCTTATAVVTVTQPTAITASASAGTVSCNGGTTTLTVTASGGIAPLQYSLNGGVFQSGNTFTVDAGTHSVAVRDANSCITTAAAVTITQPAAIIASASAGTITCNGGTTTLTVTATGGTGVLEYSLNGGVFQPANAFTVNAGTHNVTVRDANGCIATATAVTVIQPAAIIVSASAGTIICNGGTTTLTVTATGGAGALEYSLNGGAFQPGNTFIVIEGTHTVTVRDASACIATTVATVTQPATITATASTGTIVCNNGVTTLTVTASGGTGALQYSLNGGVFQAGNAFAINGGTYIVTVKDANGCTAVTTAVTVTQPTAITASATAGTIVCYGGTATLTVTATGGTGPLEYSLNGGAYQPGIDFTVSAGTHTVVVRDANRCTATAAAVTITQPTTFTASASVSTIACNGGTIPLVVAVTGGTAPFQYRLNGGAYQPGNTFIVGAGTYTVTVKDTNSCTATTTAVTVTQPIVLIASATAKRITQCGGTADVTVTASGGTAPYTGVGTFTRGPGTWSFIVMSAGGCRDTTDVTIEAPGCMNLIVYPSPATNAVTIHHSIAEPGSTMKVFGINGALMITKPVPLNDFQTTINVSKLAAGPYVVVYWNGREKKATKFEKL